MRTGSTATKDVRNKQRYHGDKLAFYITSTLIQIRQMLVMWRSKHGDQAVPSAMAEGLEKMGGTKDIRDRLEKLKIYP